MAKMATHRYLMTLLAQKGMLNSRHEYILQYTNGRTQSTKELTPIEVNELCRKLAGKTTTMDTRRKRVLAAIHGVFKIGNKKISQQYAIAIAVRAAGKNYQNFNDIPEGRLVTLYNQFLHAQRDHRFAHRLIDGMITEQQSYN